jgi:type I restriction enzyme, S subunit
MNRMQAWSGMFAVSELEGLVSPDYSVFATTTSIEVKFFEHLFKTPFVVDQFAQASKGIGSGFNRLYTPDFGAVPVAVPTPSEQSAIVRFLDHADRRIRKYIRAKQKLIKLLEEQKQALIHRAVTRGLDPNVRLQPSGVEWLGEVPAHWEIVRLKFATTHIVDCLHATPTYVDDGEFPAIRTADISPGEVRISTAKRVNAEEFKRWIQRMEPKAGDILYSREGERFGIAACVPRGAKLCISQRMMIFRSAPRCDPDFLMWALNSPQVYAQACQDVMGATAPHINVSTIRNYQLALPCFDEQQQVVRYVSEATAGLETAVKLARSEIELVREYRVRQIADVVTGKLDVREAAAGLPPSLADDEFIEATEVEVTAEESADDLDALTEEDVEA